MVDDMADEEWMGAARPKEKKKTKKKTETGPLLLLLFTVTVLRSHRIVCGVSGCRLLSPLCPLTGCVAKRTSVGAPVIPTGPRCRPSSVELTADVSYAMGWNMKAAFARQPREGFVLSFRPQQLGGCFTITFVSGQGGEAPFVVEKEHLTSLSSWWSSIARQLARGWLLTMHALFLASLTLFVVFFLLQRFAVIGFLPVLINCNRFMFCFWSSH